MDIIFNGKAREIQDGICIQELLDQMQLDCMQVVVEHNKNIIPRQRLAETPLNNGDKIGRAHV